jgi:hypothetical protein
VNDTLSTPGPGELTAAQFITQSALLIHQHGAPVASRMLAYVASDLPPAVRAAAIRDAQAFVGSSEPPEWGDTGSGPGYDGTS